MKLTFELSVDQANIVMAGLGELPLKIAEPVVAFLRQQAAPQMTPSDVADVAEVTQSPAE